MCDELGLVTEAPTYNALIDRVLGLAPEMFIENHYGIDTTRMHNPPHPGELLREWIPQDMGITEAARALRMNRVTLSNLLNGRASVTANIALRLSAWLGTSPELWIGMQGQWDLWQAEQQPRPKIKPLALPPDAMGRLISRNTPKEGTEQVNAHPAP